MSPPTMATADPSPSSNGDTTEKPTEQITDVRDLDVDDAILVGDRSRPITVDRVGVRTQPLADGDPDQHFVYASGSWSDAKRVELHNEIHISGDLTGNIINAETGRATDVRRVSEGDR